MSYVRVSSWESVDGFNCEIKLFVDVAEIERCCVDVFVLLAVVLIATTDISVGVRSKLIRNLQHSQLDLKKKKKKSGGSTYDVVYAI